MPVKEFTIPDGIAPSGAIFYKSDLMKEWKNDFFVAALRGYVVRLKFDEQGAIQEIEKVVPNGLSRVRDVESGSDGSLYILSDRGTITQVRPAK